VWRRIKQRGRPVLERTAARIDELLAEWKGRTTAKQRITATRVHRQLVEEGFQAGITTVRGYLREKKRQQAEVFIPLVHRPGDEAQVDFFEVTVDQAGVRSKVWKLVVRLMYSGADFAWLYNRCDQLAFLDGHVRAFAYFGGVPARMVYDNLAVAVKTRIGLRQLTDRFLALSTHYLFEPCFARPGEGHDKGGVESRGKGIRLQHLTPIPQGETLDEISSSLLANLERARSATVHERFAEEIPRLRSLPERPFQARRTEVHTASRQATVRIAGVTYSLPSHWHQLNVTAHVGVEDVHFVCMTEAVLRKRPRAGRQIVYRDYLPELARKPQALRQVAPELLAELGEPYAELWSRLTQHHGELPAARVLAQLVACLGSGEQDEAAIKRLLDAALAAAGRPAAQPSQPTQSPAVVPERLRGYRIESARAADFDVLLAGGTR
jgi:transposase